MKIREVVDTLGGFDPELELADITGHPLNKFYLAEGERFVTFDIGPPMHLAQPIPLDGD